VPPATLCAGWVEAWAVADWVALPFMLPDTPPDCWR